MSAKKRVLVITQEMKPYLDLTDISTIVSSLPQKLQQQKLELRVLMPRFGSINERRHRLHEVVRLSGINIVVNDEDYPLIIKVASLPGARLQVYFLDSDDLKEIRLLQEEFKKREKEYKEQQKLEQRHQNDWQIAKKSSNITQLKSFLERYPNSSYREEAEKLIKDIKEEEKRKKEAEINKKAKEKWEAIHKAEKKFLKEALIRFINDFPTSSYIEEAKKELEELENSNKAPNTDLDFSQVRDLRGIERVIKTIKNPTDEDKQNLIDVIKQVASDLNAKNRKKFLRSKYIIGWIGKDKLIELLN